ncbi:DMT family transporter [Roseburia sp. OM04-10BH]|uniref:DMT family transporter n=1 Tax=unclassified Roseburia TaxID=2637578 RepID=UPI000E4A38D5|nr:MULTISPECIES: DMT family transporter [unclassified Roseburia]RGI46571.1 DMT family transporter [Roseburia sp. OM04-10BH]RHV43849.1 DMT family transporter [Roseburia sp. OM04-15AA]RHV56852.1 DMT family transporter [Roseburia sp. OM04-10AA]
MKQEKRQGILFIIGAGFFFALMTFFVRLSGDLPTMEKAFFRNAVAAVVAAFLLIRAKEPFYAPKKSWSGLFMRSFCGTVGLICNFYAIDRLNIADANMLNKLSPFFAIIMSTFILKEKANKVEWGAVVLAFTGALLVIKPSFDIQFVYGLIGALGGLGAGIAYTYVRKLGKMGVKGPVIVLCFSLFSCVVTLPFFIIGYKPMDMAQFACLMLAGICAAGGQICITTAYTKAPAKEISVFDYTQIVFAALLGILFLDQIPDVLSIAGYIVIIGTAIFKWQYNMKYDT